MSGTTLARQGVVPAVGRQIGWLQQDLLSTATEVAEDIMGLRRSYYHRQFNPNRPIRMKLTRATKKIIRRLSGPSGFSHKEVRRCFSDIVEETIGENSEVVCGRRTIKVKRF